MTDYTPIPASDVSDNAPVRERTVTRIRDNPIAVTEAATGAPRLTTNAFADRGIPVEKIDAAAREQRLVMCSVVLSNQAAASPPLRILSSYNVQSVTETTAGHYTIAFLTDMATANYFCSGMPIIGSLVDYIYPALDRLQAKTVSEVHIVTVADGIGGGGVIQEVERFSFQCHGNTQA